MTNLATVEQEEKKYRGPVMADHSSEGNHRQRLADSQAEDRERNLARQSGDPYPDEAPAPLSPEKEAIAIAYQMGIGVARPFILRMLVLEKRVAQLEELTSLLRR